MINTLKDYQMTLLESELQQEHLLIIADEQGKRAIALEAAMYSIGRDFDNSIVLYSNLVSRHHAILLRVTNPDDATYLFRLIDVNLQGSSSNGLIINEHRCCSHDLKHGDVIAFGSNVTAIYYTTARSNREFLPPNIEDVTVNFNSNTHFQTLLTSKNIELNTSIEAASERLTSFPVIAILDGM